MKINPEFRFNKVVLITSPRVGEEGITRRLIENITDISNNGGNFNFCNITANDGLGFFQALEFIRQEILSGIKPIIYFDCHGDEKKGLELGISGEFIAWQAFIDELRILNIALNNELFVFITACHGLYLSKKLSLKKEAPFLNLVAPDVEIDVEDIETKVPKFFRVLFESHSLVQACDELGPKFSLFNTVSIFFEFSLKYFEQNHQGKGKKLWREYFLTQVVKNGMPNSSENRRKVRQQIKTDIEPYIPKLLEQLAQKFLMSKASLINMVDIIDELERSATSK